MTFRSFARDAAALALFVPLLTATAQQRNATITGRVIDASTGAGLSNVGVQLVGTTLGMQSGIDGRYTIRDVPPGTITVQARRIGFAAKTVTALMAAPGQTVDLDITLQPASVQLTAQLVTAAAERGTVSAALDAQRTAVGVVSTITSEQIAKSADADAAQAVKRVSGVTVQDGRYVFVRGLGERYTTTSLNGARVPSPEPEKKVVPLDLFPAGLLQTITTTKTFTPDQPGDFSGASVDIRTREFPATHQVTYAATIGANTLTMGKQLPYSPTAGGEWLAWSGNGRSLPSPVAAQGDFLRSQLTALQKNQLANSFRNVWTPRYRGGTPNTSFSASVGGDSPLFGRRIGYLASATYSYAQDVHDQAERALALRGDTPGSTLTSDRFVGTEAGNSVLWGGLLNLSSLFGEHSRLSLNSTYNRTADNTARSETGSFENEGIAARIDLLDYVQRTVYSSQLMGEHEIGSRHAIDWAATASGVRRGEPDRSEFVYQIANPGADDAQLLWLNTGTQGAVRTFSALSEDNAEGRANYRLFLGSARSSSLKLGGLFRHTHRSADAKSYSLSASSISQEVRALRPEQIFDGRFANADTTVFQIAPLGQGGSYTASDNLSAGFAMTELALTQRLHLIGGARVEYDDVTLAALSTLGSRDRQARQWTDVLPSAALNIALTDAQNLRLSASRTVARPEYREMANVGTFDVINSDVQLGNPRLERTRIDNADVRWEWYPDLGEVLSVGAFAKRFDRPIEMAYVGAGSAQPKITWINAASADNYGIELEARKGLGFLGNPLAPFTAFSNVTAMRSEIHIDNSEVVFTNSKRRMVGQAPYVVNAGLTYTSRGGASSATVLYNRVGERIVAAGADPLPDVRELSRDVLDFSLRLPLRSGISGRFDAKNLFDAPYTQVQGTVVRERYLTGRVFQFGVVWHP